jgi:hypothetical protein
VPLAGLAAPAVITSNTRILPRTAAGRAS